MKKVLLMAMEKSVARALARQVKAELDSAYFFIQAADWFVERGLPGFANWMRKQAHEEVGHALVVFNFVNGRNACVDMEMVNATRHGHDTLPEALSCALSHMREVVRLTGQSRHVAELSEDGAAMALLDGVIAEVGLVVEHLVDIIHRVASADDAEGLPRLDDECGKRKFVVPVLMAGKGMDKFEVVNAC